MPVVSQSRFSTTSSTSLSNSLSSGSYRSTLNSSTSLERPFYSSASGSYVRPCSHRSAFSSNSVTEYRSQLSYDGDGVRERKTSYSSDYSRYSRAPSVSDSDSAISCDSRLTSRADRSGSKSRDTSVARSDSGRASRSDPSAKSIANLSSAEFYKKYSPFNYIPQAQRLSTAVTGPNGEANRSKLLAGDAARLPLPRRVSARPVLDDEVKSKTNNTRSAVKRHTNSTPVVKPCATVPPECVTNTDRVTNDPVKRDVECTQRQSRSLRASEALSAGRSTSGLIPRARIQTSWSDRKPAPLVNGYHDSSTDDNGNQLSVAEIRRKFDPKMTVTRHNKEPLSLYKTAHSSDNIYSQVRSLNNSVSFLHLDDKPAPVHKPTIDKYVNGATGSLRWEFFSPSSSQNPDSKGGQETGYTIKHATDPGSDISTIYIAGKMNAERLPLNAVKNQLNANNPIGRILEKATTVYVGNGDVKTSSSMTPHQERNDEAKNVLNIEIGTANNKTYEKAEDETTSKKALGNHTSDFASYIQVSTPIASGVQNNAEPQNKDVNNQLTDSPMYTNDSPAKSISCLLSSEDLDSSKLRYIDSEPNSESDNRLFIDYNAKDENNFEEQGFENKTFEHENGHLLRKSADETDYGNSVIKIKQNGLDDVEFVPPKKVKQNADENSMVHTKVSIINQNGISKLTNGILIDDDIDLERNSNEKTGEDELSTETTLAMKKYQDINGEGPPSIYQNDSGISRGDSPVTAAQPSSGAANNTGSSTCGTLSSNSGAPSSSRRGTLATHGTGHLSKTSGLNGLRNIGNTCFMNSVVQCLSNTRPLMEYCGDQDSFTPDINTTLSCMKGALIKAFSTVICELWREGESDGVVNTTALKAQIQRFAPRFMGYSQQDAQEFLRYLLEGLHEDVNRVTIKPKPILTEIDDNLSDAQKAQESWNRYLRSEDSRVGDIFVGQLKSSLRCTHCNHTSVTFDPFWDLSLPIPSRTGQLKLTQCLSHFTKEEELDGDEKPTCSKCQVRRKCLKWFTIQKFPRVLVLHLKRFSPQERFRGKLNVLVEFPLTGLDLSHCSATPKHHEYNLYAVSNHSGTTYSGHYTAYCKHPYNGEWHEYNDSRVSPISSKNVVSSEAYVLFYELANSSSASS